ncbi:GNAT family N-acetyltransferase [Clostridium sp. CF012]|uniref:GNAT family N-acetyltransferase n=1 Tax=Clostridium sp. CF012 TaxID=2843319 RepID=UPI001C0BA56D|nr:GNAT family N-acetyltransferase [Clostridium sp. CF012]
MYSYHFYLLKSIRVNRLSFYIWAIVFKESDEPIGSIGLFIIKKNDICCDVGYSIGKKYWGQGIIKKSYLNSRILLVIIAK